LQVERGNGHRFKRRTVRARGQLGRRGAAHER
jgi:hypothetical protein